VANAEGATAPEKTRRGPRAQLREISGVGHAPASMNTDQIDVVRTFLGEH
jgi:hypothetical protein